LSWYTKEKEKSRGKKRGKKQGRVIKSHHICPGEHKKRIKKGETMNIKKIILVLVYKKKKKIKTRRRGGEVGLCH